MMFPRRCYQFILLTVNITDKYLQALLLVCGSRASRFHASRLPATLHARTRTAHVPIDHAL